MLKPFYSLTVCKKKPLQLLTPLEKQLTGSFSKRTSSNIYLGEIDSSGTINSNTEREALAIVFVVTGLKQFFLRRRFTLQTDHKPLKYLFASDEEVSKTASVRITKWATALMGLDFELKYTPGKQLPHADALSRMDVDGDESNNNLVCFTISNIYFIHSDLVTQPDIKIKLGTSSLFQGLMKRIESGIGKQSSEAEKGFEHRYIDNIQWNHFQKCFSFHSTQKSASWENCN